MTKTLTLAALALATALSTAPSFAADEHNAVPGLTKAGAPLGLHGVDPAALIQRRQPIEGTATHTVVHDGVSYYFATAANAEAFRKSPAKYVPQNGGFCTFGVSVGKKFDGDPRFADVVDGKLYVFLNEDVFKEYQKDKAGTIAKAEANWKTIQHTAAKDL